MQVEAIPTKEDFSSLCNELNLLQIECEKAQAQLVLRTSPESFLQFAKRVSDTVFVYYSYPKLKDLLIDGETIDALPHNDFLNSCFNVDYNWQLDFIIHGEESKYAFCEDEENSISSKSIRKDWTTFERKIADAILAYNSKIDKSFLNRPFEMCAYVPHNGALVGIELTTGIDFAQLQVSALLDILANHSKEMENQIEEQALKEEELLKQLKDFLISDPDFRASTNQRLRKEYTQTLWRKRDLDWLHELFGDSSWAPSKLYYAVERAYAEYKEAKRTK